MGLALDEPNENEPTISVNDMDLLISDEVKPFVGEKMIDYIQTPAGEGFIIGNKSGESCC